MDFNTSRPIRTWTSREMNAQLLQDVFPAGSAPRGPPNDAFIDLHPEATRRECFVSVSKFELDSLMKINKIQAEEKEHHLDQIRRLEEANMELRRQVAASSSEEHDRLLGDNARLTAELHLRRENEHSLEMKLYDARRKLMAYEQQEKYYECKIKSLNELLSRQEHETHVKEVYRNVGMAETWGCDSVTADQLVNVKTMVEHRQQQELEPVPVAPASASRTPRPSEGGLQTHVHDLARLLEAAQTQVEKIRSESARTSAASVADIDVGTEKVQELNKRLEMVEAMHASQRVECESLRQQNDELTAKVQRLEQQGQTDNTLHAHTVQQNGRFEVRTFSTEHKPIVCRPAFDSRGEADQSVYVFQGEFDEGKTWPYTSKGIKIPKINKQVQHIAAKKRSRH